MLKDLSGNIIWHTSKMGYCNTPCPETGVDKSGVLWSITRKFQDIRQIFFTIIEKLTSLCRWNKGNSKEIIRERVTYSYDDDCPPRPPSISLEEAEENLRSSSPASFVGDESVELSDL